MQQEEDELVLFDIVRKRDVAWYIDKDRQSFDWSACMRYSRSYSGRRLGECEAEITPCNCDKVGVYRSHHATAMRWVYMRLR